MNSSQADPSPIIAMVFAGGLGLAAYHAGVYEAFLQKLMPLHWVAGSSAGAVTAAIIAGNHADDRLERLRALWNFPPSCDSHQAPWRHLYGWMSAIRTRLVGSPGHFYPTIPFLNAAEFKGLYDLGPLKQRISELVDFGRLNSGETRICIAATDVETGEAVIFDSAKRIIERDHLLASCGFLPEFAPVEVDGRLLGDGGLSLNAPFDPILYSETARDLVLYVVDLYPRDGPRPVSLETAVERKNDLLFGNQTFIRLKYAAELSNLRNELANGRSQRKIVLLSYRPGREEPGPEKAFELSPSAFAQRWNAGLLDMKESEHATQSSEVIVVRRAV